MGAWEKVNLVWALALCPPWSRGPGHVGGLRMGAWRNVRLCMSMGGLCVTCAAGQQLSAPNAFLIIIDCTMLQPCTVRLQPAPPAGVTQPQASQRELHSPESITLTPPVVGGSVLWALFGGSFLRIQPLKFPFAVPLPRLPTQLFSSASQCHPPPLLSLCPPPSSPPMCSGWPTKY